MSRVVGRPNPVWTAIVAVMLTVEIAAYFANGFHWWSFVGSLLLSFVLGSRIARAVYTLPR